MTKEMNLEKKRELIEAIGVSAWLHKTLEVNPKFKPDTDEFWIIAQAGAVLLQYEPPLIEALLSEALK